MPINKHKKKAEKWECCATYLCEIKVEVISGGEKGKHP